MCPLIPRGLGQLFYGQPTLAAYRGQLPVNGRLAVIADNQEGGDVMFDRIRNERAAANARN